MPALPLILRRVMLMVLAWLALLATGRAAPVSFNITAQGGDAALVAFARQAGVEVLFSSAELKQVRTSAVVGLYEPEAAIALLLRGTGFTAARSSTGKFMVVRERRRASAGEIRGTIVAKSDNRPIANAVIRRAGATVGTRARDDGSFILRDVVEDAHTVQVQAEGFAPMRIADVVVEAGRRTDLREIQLVTATDEPQQLGELIVNASDLATLSVPVVLALQEVVVSPSRFGIDEERGTVAATLTESDLLALPQLGDDLYRAISHLPGLAADDITARFWVRGAPNDQVLARLDGVDLIEPFHLKDIDGALSILDLETISRLDLFTGGFAAEYGDRLAGVLTMETDRHVRAKSRTTLGVSLTGGRASNRGQTTDGRGRWLVSARTGYPDLALEQTDNGNNEGDSRLQPRYHDLMAKWEWQLTPNQVLSFHALHAADRLFFRDSDGPTLTSKYGSDYAWIRWRGDLGRVTGEGVLSYSALTWRRDGGGLLDQFYPLDIHDGRDLRVIGLRQDWSMGLSERALLRGGMEFKSGRASYDYTVRRDQPVVRNNLVQIDQIVRNARLEPEGQSLGAYFAVRTRPFESLTLEPGLRFDGNNYAHDSDVSPRLNAALNPGATTWRAAWGWYSQAQGLQRLAVQDGDTVFRPAEMAEHRVLSVEHRLKSGINLRLEGYQRIVRRPRPHWENVLGGSDAVSEVEGDRVRIAPVRQEAHGVELIAERRAGKRFTWSGSYAYARTEETLPGGVTILRPRDQRHTLYTDLTYTPSPRWQFSVAWQYHNGWPTSEINFSRVALASGGNATLGTINHLYGVNLPAYQRVDVRMQRRFQLKNSTLRAYIDVFNAFNRTNIIGYDYRLTEGPNRQLVTNRVPGGSLFPRLPSVGLTWDF
ncbi:MAG TPA: TonB-dependent receptor [Opitutaceae bacterium]|nr:TonB-dependent receptor [Opitutaceae bacterium]